jgi:hypothetical protein
MVDPEHFVEQWAGQEPCQKRATPAIGRPVTGVHASGVSPTLLRDFAGVGSLRHGRIALAGRTEDLPASSRGVS